MSTRGVIARPIRRPEEAGCPSSGHRAWSGARSAVELNPGDIHVNKNDRSALLSLLP
jgi:hypothetical protein